MRSGLWALSPEAVKHSQRDQLNIARPRLDLHHLIAADADLLGNRREDGLPGLVAPPLRQVSGPVEIWTREMAGVELLKWMYDTTWYADYMQRTQGSALPVTKATVETPFYQSHPIRSVLIQQQQTAVRYGGPVYGTTPYTGEAEGKLLFSQPVTDVLNGKRTVDDGVAFLDRELKTLAGQ
jgi:hypothetical protein